MKATCKMVGDKPIIFVDGTETDFGACLVESGAMLSEDETYRYLLWRVWNIRRPFLGWLMLNSSTADHEKNDNTILGTIARAKAWGYGGTVTANLFAFRTKSPAVLKAYRGDPIGPMNDAAIGLCAKATQRLICGWGTHGSYLDRGPAVLRMLRKHGITPYALHINDDGSPKHPLYIAHDVYPKVMP